MKSARWFIPMLFVILLLACQTSRITEQIAAPGATLFEDDFSDSASGWPRIGSPEGAMDYSGDAYRVLLISTDYDLWAVSGHEFSNVRVEVDAGPLGGPVEDRYGLICRYRDGRNFYFFIVSADGYYAIGKAHGGVYSLLGQDAMVYGSAIVTGVAFNHLRFDCVGDTLTGYVNDQLVAVVQDADFAAGDVGLLAGAFGTPGVDVLFDNFLVIKP